MTRLSSRREGLERRDWIGLEDGTHNPCVCTRQVFLRACAKLVAALAFIAWSSENDGAATDFLIVAATQYSRSFATKG